MPVAEELIKKIAEEMGLKSIDELILRHIKTGHAEGVEVRISA